MDVKLPVPIIHAETKLSSQLDTEKIITGCMACFFQDHPLKFHSFFSIFSGLEKSTMNFRTFHGFSRPVGTLSNCSTAIIWYTQKGNEITL